MPTPGRVAHDPNAYKGEGFPFQFSMTPGSTIAVATDVDRWMVPPEFNITSRGQQILIASVQYHVAVAGTTPSGTDTYAFVLCDSAGNSMGTLFQSAIPAGQKHFYQDVRTNLAGINIPPGLGLRLDVVSLGTYAVGPSGARFMLSCEAYGITA